MQILLIMLIVVLPCVLGPASGAGKTKSQGKADRRRKSRKNTSGIMQKQ